MADKDLFETKLSILMKEWDYTQTHIGRLDTIIFNLRQWSVTILAGFFAGAVATRSPNVMLPAMVSTVLFWMNEAVWKVFQRHFTTRSHDIEAYLSSNAFSSDVESRKFGFVTPRMGAQFRRGTIGNRARAVLVAAGFRNVVLVHASLLVICIVAYVSLKLGLKVAD
jgi:hypothetical protein